MAVIREWRGKEILAATDVALSNAINATNLQAVALARRPFPIGVPIRTGFASANLNIEPAQRQGTKIIGYFYGGAVYTIWIELRYGFMRRAWEEALDGLYERLSREYRL